MNKPKNIVKFFCNPKVSIFNRFSPCKFIKKNKKKIAKNDIKDFRAYLEEAVIY